MKITKIIPFLFFLFIHIYAFAQHSKFAVSASYPLTMGNNFFDRNNGIVDVGIQYTLADTKAVQLGVALNAAFFNYENTGISTKENVMVLQPKLVAELNVPALKGFKPFVGLGYAAFSFRSEFDNGNQVIEEDDNTGGLNLNVGLAKDIVAGFFVHVQYDYMNIERSDASVPDQEDPFYRNVNILKFGLGYRF